jgi:hypothetical protein
MLVKRRVPYRVPFYPDMVGAHLFVNRPTTSILEHLFQKLHEKIWVDLFSGFLSRILEPIVLPPQVNLFLQRNDTVGLPIGSHIDSRQVVSIQSIDFVG